MMLRMMMANTETTVLMRFDLVSNRCQVELE
jgi:hypothetical protein